MQTYTPYFRHICFCLYQFWSQYIFIWCITWLIRPNRSAHMWLRRFWYKAMICVFPISLTQFSITSSSTHHMDSWFNRSADMMSKHFWRAAIIVFLCHNILRIFRLTYRNRQKWSLSNNPLMSHCQPLKTLNASHLLTNRHTPSLDVRELPARDLEKRQNGQLLNLVFFLCTSYGENPETLAAPLLATPSICLKYCFFFSLFTEEQFVLLLFKS